MHWLREFNPHLLYFFVDDQLDRVRDEFRVLLDDILDLFLLEVFKLVLLEVEADLGTTAKRGAFGVGSNGESSTGGRLPDVLFVIVVLGHNLHALSDKVGRVETDTELTNHGNIGTGAHSLHETLQRVLEIGREWDRKGERTLVPDLAMVPRLLTMSALVMPIPVSRRRRNLPSLSALIRM